MGRVGRKWWGGCGLKSHAAIFLDSLYAPLIIESGSLSVALSPEETAGGVAGSATSTVYTIMAIKLRVEAQHNIGGQLAWS